MLELGKFKTWLTGRKETETLIFKVHSTVTTGVESDDNYDSELILFSSSCLVSQNQTSGEPEPD